MPEWTWERAPPRERAEMVRNHTYGAKPLSWDAIKELFCLTDIGMRRIMAGDIWRPEYQQTPGA